MFLENLTYGGPHGQFPQAGTLYFPACTEELGTSIFRPAQTAEPRCAVVDDVGHAAKGLDVIDHGGFAKQSHYWRKRWLRPRVGALAFQCIQQPGLVPANVTAAAEG